MEQKYITGSLVITIYLKHIIWKFEFLKYYKPSKKTYQENDPSWLYGAWWLTSYCLSVLFYLFAHILEDISWNACMDNVVLRQYC